MKRFLILIMSIVCLPAAAFGQPSIGSVSGNVVAGNNVTIAGNSFGSHPDYGGNGNFLCARWETWEDNDFSGMQGYAAWNVYGAISIISTDQRNNSSYSLKRSAPDGVAWAQFTNQDQAGTYTAFWYRASSDYTLSGGSNQEKVNRLYSSGASSYSNYYFKIAPSGSNVNVIWNHEKVAKASTNLKQISKGSWHFLECWVERDLGAGGGVDQVWVDGTRYINWNNITSASNARYNGAYNWGNYFSGSQTGTYSQMDDIYVSHTLARVVIGNNSSYSACTNWAIQPPVSWSDTSITITVNQGSFANCETVYLFVVDAGGNVNTAGYPIRIVTGAGKPPCPPVGGKISK